MLFNSVQFLFFFAIIVFIYFILPQKARWVMLLISSYYFYMCWNAKYALLMALSTVVTYTSGILLGQASKRSKNQLKKLWVMLSFIINLSILFFFKYYNLFTGTLSYLGETTGFPITLPAFDVVLPVGISFYTFQALSYTVDVYRGDLPYERNLARYALFVSFFPQLVAGPIERSTRLLPQLKQTHSFSFERLFTGLQLMLWGLFQKIAIADRVAVIVNTVYENYASYSGIIIVFSTLLFGVQIYCDFSAYSDIAVGAARVLGIDLMQNFKRPYFASSIKEFWQRWHISLSTWFRDYLYIPLGGNRCSKPRRYFNIMVTFLVSGLWHGANWTFVAWGALHGLFQIIGDMLQPLRQRAVKLLHIKTNVFSFKLLQVVLIIALVNIAWVFFRANSIADAAIILQKSFFDVNLNALFDGTLFSLGLSRAEMLFTIFAIGVLACVSIIRERTLIAQQIKNQNLYFRWALYIVTIFTILFVVIHNATGVSQEFIYFQF